MRKHAAAAALHQLVLQDWGGSGCARPLFALPVQQLHELHVLKLPPCALPVGSIREMSSLTALTEMALHNVFNGDASNHLVMYATGYEPEARRSLADMAAELSHALRHLPALATIKLGASAAALQAAVSAASRHSHVAHRSSRSAKGQRSRSSSSGRDSLLKVKDGGIRSKLLAVLSGVGAAVQAAFGIRSLGHHSRSHSSHSGSILSQRLVSLEVNDVFMTTKLVAALPTGLTRLVLEVGQHPSQQQARQAASDRTWFVDEISTRTMPRLGQLTSLKELQLHGIHVNYSAGGGLVDLFSGLVELTSLSLKCDTDEGIVPISGTCPTFATCHSLASSGIWRTRRRRMRLRRMRHHLPRCVQVSCVAGGGLNPCCWDVGCVRLCYAAGLKHISLFKWLVCGSRYVTHTCCYCCCCCRCRRAAHCAAPFVHPISPCHQHPPHASSARPERPTRGLWALHVWATWAAPATLAGALAGANH